MAIQMKIGSIMEETPKIKKIKRNLIIMNQMILMNQIIIIIKIKKVYLRILLMV
jgi:hypothetical protein